MTYKQIIKRLLKAKTCCALCGLKHGNRRASLATWNYGKCDICCTKHIEVTEPRDFGGFSLKIREIEKELKKEAKLKEKRRKQRIKEAESSSKLKIKADALFSKIIRLSYADENGNCKCVTCPKILPWGDMTNGHWISRKVLSTRYNTHNCHPQCWGCQAKHLGNGEAHKHEIYIVDNHGAEARDKLLELSKKLQYDIDYKGLISEYNNTITTLLQNKGL